MPKWISWTPTDVPPSSMPSRSVTPIALNFYSTVEPIQITRTKRAERTLCHIIKNKNTSTTNSTVFLYYFKAGVLRCHQRTDGNFEVFSSTSSGSLVEKHKRRCFTSRSCRLRTQGSRPLDPATMSTTVRRKWNRIGRIG